MQVDELLPFLRENQEILNPRDKGRKSISLTRFEG